jgi:FAD/FMN-containing dehydrogenase
MSDLEWQQHYGSAWPMLARAKQRYDPDRLFASGPDLFRGRAAR